MHFCLSAQTTLLELSWEGKHHPLRTPTSLKGYLQILFGPGLILSHPHWLSVLLPPSFTLLSPQVPALIAAPTLQVSLLSHLLCISHTWSLSSSLTRSWSHSPFAIPTDITSPQACSLWRSKDAGTSSLGCEPPSTPFWCGSRGLGGFMDSWAVRTVTLAVH